MRDGRFRRRLRLAGAAAALGVAAVAAFGAHSPARADGSAVAVDRQSYRADTPVDPYNADTLNLHVAVAGGSEVARSFVHLAFDGLPPGASLTGASLTLAPSSDQTQNINVSAAIVQACVLTKGFPAQFDPANPPPYDCSKGSSVAKVSGGNWSFDLRDLVAYWRGAGNTGAAIVPVGAPGETWSVAFDKTLTGATAAFTPPNAASGSGSSPAPAAAGGASVAGPDLGSQAGPSAASLPVTPANPAVGAPESQGAPAPAVAQGQTGTPSRSTDIRTVPGHRSSAWIWVLLGVLVASALLVGQPLVAVATAGAGKVRQALGAQVRSHGRAVVTSAVLLLWTVTYGVYSVVVTPTPRLIGGASSAAPGSSTAAAAAGGEASGATGGAATLSGSAAAGGTGGGGSGRSGRAGSGAAGGSASDIAASEANLPAAAKLYSGADDTVGITNDTITLCGHAALTFGPAFNIGKSDLNVFWQNLNDHGGIHGRKFKLDWQDDSYMPANAVTAAQACKDEGTFILLGGIGFDQIPAVRVWAEQNHELYLHHIAVQRGSEGLRYSFTALPSVEQMGRTFGQLAVQKYKGMKVGVLWRNSSNWQPGRDEFEKVVKAAGMQIVGDYAVQNNQGNYTQQIVELKSAGAQVVFAWENALGATEMIRQAKAQAYSPHWLLFPFNLTLQTIGNDANNPPLDGLAAWPAYSANDHAGPYASYAADLAEFEREYKQYDPNANLSGPGGDLLFLAWTGFKQLADMFNDCGPDCTRNKFAGLMLNGYNKTVTPNCDADFSTGDRHHAAPRMDVLTTTAGSNGPKWIPTQRCISSLGP